MCQFFLLSAFSYNQTGQACICMDVLQYLAMCNMMLAISAVHAVQQTNTDMLC